MSDKTPAKERATQAGQTDWAALDAMSDEEAEAAALADPDASPSPSETTLRRMSRAKHVRFGLRLTREEFADRYHIPVGVVKAWESHVVEPGAVGRAYLDAIAGDPEGVAKSLQLAHAKQAAAE